MSTVEEAIEALTAGLPVVLPTDTVYGLAVDPARAGATDRLFDIKERPLDAALPVLATDRDQAFSLAADVPEVARRLADRFWPGGITLVIPRKSGLAFDLGGRDDTTIGVRVPDHPVPREIASRVGPIAATSANLHGRPTPESVEGVLAELDERVSVVVDGGPCAGAPSTVVACTADEIVILREGRVSRRAIEAAIEDALGSRHPPIR
jgi:L-threonylcarbamoyladenylate synthase